MYLQYTNLFIFSATTSRIKTIHCGDHPLLNHGIRCAQSDTETTHHGLHLGIEASFSSSKKGHSIDVDKQ